MTFTVTITMRDDKTRVYECAERPSIDNMFTRLYVTPQKTILLRSEMMDTIIVVENRNGSIKPQKRRSKLPIVKRK